MNSATAAPTHLPFPPARVEQDRSSAPRVQMRGVLLIGSGSLFLALATANECQSITHLPSLLYGLVLWGWWGLIASSFWLSGPRLASPLNRSLPHLALHAVIACAAAVVHLMLLGSLSLVIPEWQTHAPATKVLTGLITTNRFGFEILIYGFIFGLIGIMRAQIRAQQDALNRWNSNASWRQRSSRLSRCNSSRTSC